MGSGWWLTKVYASMGSLESPFEVAPGMVVTLPSDVYVVANSQEIERLRAAAALRRLADLNCVSLAPAEPIPGEVVARAAVLVIEVDPTDKASLRRIAQVRAARRELPLVVALHDASASAIRTLVRQGVDDVVSIPLDLDDLATQLLDLVAQIQSNAAAQAPLAPLISVVRSTGGSGATTVVTHLAAALAEQSGRANDACVVDLDIQFGNVAMSLGCEAKTTVVDLLEAGDRLDVELLQAGAVDTRRGFDVIAAPFPITPLENVDVDRLLHLLTVARRKYGCVLVDLPANWTNWTLSTALASTDIVLVTDLTIAGLRQAKRRVELFDTVGIPRDRLRIVVNRVEKRLFRAIGVEEVRRTLGHPVYATLAAELSVLANAQDQGLLAWEANRRSRFASDISDLADRLVKGWRH